MFRRNLWDVHVCRAHERHLFLKVFTMEITPCSANLPNQHENREAQRRLRMRPHAKKRSRASTIQQTRRGELLGESHELEHRILDFAEASSLLRAASPPSRRCSHRRWYGRTSTQSGGARRGVHTEPTSVSTMTETGHALCDLISPPTLFCLVTIKFKPS